ncbi:hypothetical protein B0H34DRAFT_753183 [Crassisporium funariophilum]|nr:hypothetical protein B0H34DRAFT_753183 [Crassisporium funariophilum]
MPTAALPPQSYLAWKVSLTFVHALAIGSGVYRLVHRFRLQKTWWDDYIVFVPLVLEIPSIVLFWIRFPHRFDPNVPIPSRLQALDSYWLSTLPFLTIIWSTRAILALSVARIFPPRHRARLASLILAYSMGIAWVACILVTTLSCKKLRSNKLLENELKDCIKGVGGFPRVNIFLFTVDFLADAILVAAPLVFFWKIKLPRAEHRLILSVSCGSFLTLLSAIAFAALTISNINLGEDSFLIIAGLGRLEAAVSLMVCNLAVVITCLYRLFRTGTSPLQSAGSNARDVPEDNSTECDCEIHRDSSLCPDTSERSRFLTSLTEISQLSPISGSDPSLNLQACTSTRDTSPFSIPHTS